MGFKTVWNGIFNKNKEPKKYRDIAEIILINPNIDDQDIKKFLCYLDSLEHLNHPDISIKVEQISKKLFIHISSQYEYQVNAIRKEVNNAKSQAPGVIVQWIGPLY